MLLFRTGDGQRVLILRLVYSELYFGELSFVGVNA
jgi:hypothetical protein